MSENPRNAPRTVLLHLRSKYYQNYSSPDVVAQTSDWQFQNMALLLQIGQRCCTVLLVMLSHLEMLSLRLAAADYEAPESHQLQRQDLASAGSAQRQAPPPDLADYGNGNGNQHSRRPQQQR